MLRLATTGRCERAGRMAADHLAAGGKRLRARLALASLEALGGRRLDGVGWAAAVELLHNATLVHDDIQDGDHVRRGRPTLWSVHGVAQAINAGDLMLMLPFLALQDAPHTLRGDLAAALAEYATRCVRGQVQELDLLRAGQLDWCSYLDAAEGKTGALVALPVHGAALLGGRSDAHAAALANAFLQIGLLFQLQDDLLDLYGDKGRACHGSDLYEGKVSALVVAHVARRPSERSALVELLATPRAETTPASVERAIDDFVASGAQADVLARIESLARDARDAEVLADEPALHAVAISLVHLALAPIRHLTSMEDNR